MKCESCGASLEAEEIICGNCGKSTARTAEDLQRVDPKSTAVIGWAVFAIGALALIFVIINLNVLGLSGLDFVVPIGLLATGTATIVYARSLKGK